MQVSALMTAHIVRLTWIDEEVWLSAGCDAGLQEGETMLRHHCYVVEALDDLQLALQILGLIEQRGLLVALRVGLRSIHIALAIHHLVPVPVDDWATCYAYLEYLWIVGHQRDGHESAKAPSVYSDSVGIYVWQGLQIFHALHLVLHLHLSQLAECSLLESLATVLAATVVEDEEQVSLLCHVGLPSAAGVVPAGIHIVGVRTTIYIYYSRILLVRVEVHWLHHAVVEVCLAVVGLDGTATVLWHVVSLPRVFGCEVSRALAVGSIYDSYLARQGRCGVVVVDVLSVLAQRSVVPSLAAVVYHLSLAGLGIHAEDVALDR